jgi:phenylalanyl-tRNA synthetase beta chain
MLAPLSWLKQYVEIDTPVADLAERLTLAGLEVTKITAIGDWWDAETITVGQVTAVLPHPNADRLVLVDVDYGGDEVQRVVTGAPNLFAHRGQSRSGGALPVLKVAFAQEGAALIDAYSDMRPLPKKELKRAKIRGVSSAGMVCSERELGLSEEHEGIMLLPDDAPVGTPLRDYLGDVVLEIDLTPDMARALGMIGVAREIAALTGGNLHLPPDVCEQTGDNEAHEYAGLRIDESALCNRYAGILILDVEVGESPPWMQDRLRKAGMRPISNVVDITNYVMLEWGQPLHAFDYDVLVTRAKRVGDDKPTVIVKTAAQGEKFTTLDGAERTLDDDMLMITDTAGSIALAGVMGGMESEVSDVTRNILLEAATFEGINNRRTAQKLRISSEASYRFARGVPATLNPLAARRAAELMRLYAGGRVAPGMLDEYPVVQEQPIVYTTLSDMRRILGMAVILDEIEDALRRLDFSVRRVQDPVESAGDESTFGLHRQGGETLLECVPPWYRLDIRIPADLIEEVARMVGYEQVGLTLLDEPLPVQRRNPEWETEEAIRDILVRAGLQEIINRTLTTPEEHEKLTPVGPAAGERSQYVMLANPNAPERVAMRRELLVSGLENAARNLRYTDRLATFEVGRVYLPEDDDGVLPTEDPRLGIVMCGPRRLADFHGSTESEEDMDFFDLKGVIEALFDALGFRASQIETRAAPDSGTYGPRCAEVWLNGDRLGLMGELHPQVRQAFGLPRARVCTAELRIEPMVRPHWQLDPMRPISVYPPVVEDLAFDVEEGVTNRRTEEAIWAAGGDVLERVELFDVYRGDPLPPGRKSMAYRLTYQSPERNLSEQEVAALRRRIAENVERETGGRLRSV